MSSTDRQLIRLLHGELPGESARELRQRLAGDAALRARYRRLERVWEDLSPPPAAAIPEPSGDPGFSARVMAAARRRAEGELSWSLAPAWARAASVAALAAGLVLGASFGVRPSGAGPSAVEVAALDGSTDQEAYALTEPLSLAESYGWTLAAEDGIGDTGLPASGDNGGERVQ